MRFIDSHMHFWDQAVLRPYTWLHEVPTINHRHTTENLESEAAGRLPEKIVFVEAGAPSLEEVRWVEQLAAKDPRIRAIVAKIAIDLGAQTATAVAELKLHPLVRGVRHHFEHDPIDFCARPEFIAGVRSLAPFGLSFDICCKHGQLPAVIVMVRSCPDVSFILDHGGKPAIRAGGLDPWRENIQTLARLPNLVCKFSGFATEADHQNWSTAQLRPYTDHLLDTFGPARLLFGGDWPVAKLATSYGRWLDTAAELTTRLSAAERTALFHDNAERIYRI